MTKPESETDPWAKVRTFDVSTYGDCRMERDYYGEIASEQKYQRGEYAWVDEVDAARAAEAAQHRREVAALEHEAEHEHAVATAREGYVKTLEAERDRLKAALQDVTIGMDRAGGDRDGMPECPWCQSQGRPEDAEEGYAHDVDCSLMMARAALTPQGQSTDGETR